MKSIGEPHESDGLPPSKRPRTRASTAFICGVCFTTPNENDTFKARCSHKFCGGCYEMYVRSKIKNEGHCKIHCMEENCKVILTDQDIRRLCDDASYTRYVFLTLHVGFSLITSKISRITSGSIRQMFFVSSLLSISILQADDHLQRCHLILFIY
jgi:hypothetical protein